MTSPMDTTGGQSLPGSDKGKKLPPIPQGAKIQKRALIGGGQAAEKGSGSVHRIHVNTKTPFRAITSRVRKQLDKYLRVASYSNKAFTNRLAGTKNAGLEDRVRAIQRHHQQTSAFSSSGKGGDRSGIALEDAGSVLVLGTGRAIEKVLTVASFFQKQRDCVVELRTSSLGAVDDVIEGPEDEELGFGGGEVRQRMVSCLEVSIKLRS